MSYCIQYSPQQSRKYPLRRKNKKNRVVVGIIMGTLTLVVLFGIGSVRERITAWLLPGDPEITEAALIEFVADLRSGTGFYESAQTFCKQIVDHAVANEQDPY